MAEYQVATSGTSADQETCPAHGLFAIGYCFDCRSTPVCGHDWGQLCNSCADVRKEKAAAKKQADEKARQEETQRQHAEAILATRQNHDELIKQNPHLLPNQVAARAQLSIINRHFERWGRGRNPSFSGWFWRTSFLIIVGLIVWEVTSFAVGLIVVAIGLYLMLRPVYRRRRYDLLQRGIGCGQGLSTCKLDCYEGVHKSSSDPTPNMSL